MQNKSNARSLVSVKVRELALGDCICFLVGGREAGGLLLNMNSVTDNLLCLTLQTLPLIGGKSVTNNDVQHVFVEKHGTVLCRYE